MTDTIVEAPAGARKSRADELEYGSGWRVKGVVDDTDTCEHCGAHPLKRVVGMVPLDADGNEDGEAAFFGTTCATKYVKRGTIRGKVTGAAVWTAALAAERELASRRQWAGEILAKYERVAGFDPIQKAAVFFSYNPHTADKGTKYGADSVDWFVAEANKAMEGVRAEARADLIGQGRKSLGL